MLLLREVTMKKTSILLALALALAAALTAAPASAGPPHRGGYYHGHGSRVIFGFSVGAPWGYPYAYPYYPYRYYPAYGYYPAPVIVQQQPSVYVEQPQAQPSQPPAGYWYYCAEANGYYPYVKECPAGWQRVAPQPQN